MIYPLLKPLLFSQNPEEVHENLLHWGGKAAQIPGVKSLLEREFHYEDNALRVRVGDLYFPNPVGLAAGYDKNGVALGLLEALGFGFLEVGTVTPRPQPGNDKPRLFRLPQDQAIINRMGFNNQGVEALVERVKSQPRRIPLGVNLGKNKDTPLEQAADDYINGMSKAWKVADYFTINISSPNTKGLRDLQDEAHLTPLLQEVLLHRDRLFASLGSRKPVWLKIAPDLEEGQLEVICQIALKLGIDALIVSNTTLDRQGLSHAHAQESGGLSGRPLRDKSNRVLAQTFALTQGKIPLVGVGGIFSAEDAWEKLRLGASLVQVYTGMIYQGPGLIKAIKQGLRLKLAQGHVDHLQKVIDRKINL